MVINKKKLNAFIKKFHRNLRTHLSKDLIYSPTFQNGGKLNFKMNKESNVYSSKMLIVISEKSKIDFADANLVISRLLQVRTYRDLDIVVDEHEMGLLIKFSIDDVKYEYQIIIFKNYNCSEQFVSSYKVQNGIRYYWHSLVDYVKHPDLINADWKEYLHTILNELLQKDIDLKQDINWTKLLKERRV